MNEHPSIPLLMKLTQERSAALLERDEALETIQAMKQETYCAYCGAVFPIDGDASKVGDHIATCPDHPMRDVEAKAKALRDTLEIWAKWWNGPGRENYTFPILPPITMTDEVLTDTETAL